MPAAAARAKPKIRWKAGFSVCVVFENMKMPVPVLLFVEALIEGATGLALIFLPSAVAWLLLGMELPVAGSVMARVAGIALLSLVLSCWLGREGRSPIPALAGMVAYNVLITGYLVFLGARGEFVGFLLWPAVVIHAAMIALLAIAWPRVGRPEAKV